MTEVRAGDIVESDFWTEPVRVLTVQQVGNRTKNEAVGTKTQHFYFRILSQDDLERVRIASGAARDFCGRGEGAGERSG